MIRSAEGSGDVSNYTQVLNCGAGFDTTYLNLRNQSMVGPDRCKFFEVDYPAVASLKATIVRGSRQAAHLCLIQDKNYMVDSEGNIRIGNYSIIGCDLSGVGLDLQKKAKILKHKRSIQCRWIC